MSIKCYEGTRLFTGEAAVTVHAITDEGSSSYPLPHQVVHSPDGFNWGYLGSGPSDLARSILFDLLGTPPQPKQYHAFKEHFLAPLDINEGWRLCEDDIRTWLAEQS